MSRRFSSEIGSLESRKGPKLAYNLEFRKMLREHPGLIKKAVELTNQAIAQYNPQVFQFGKDGVNLSYDQKTGRWLYNRGKHIIKDGKILVDEKGGAITEDNWIPMDFNKGIILVPGSPVVDQETGLTVTVLGRSNRENMGDLKRKEVGDYFKIDFGGKSYFVKRSFVTVNPGFVEFHNNRLAQWLIGNADIVKVVEGKLGYQDKNESWYISEWEELEKAGYRPADYGLAADDYGTPTAGTDSEEDYKYATRIIHELEEVLAEDRLAGDIDANLFYNPKTKKFILLDVTRQDVFDEKNTLGNPIKNKGKL